MQRFGLRDDQWERIKDFLPGRDGHVGGNAADNRLFVDAVLYRYRTGIPWRDLPVRFGDWKAIQFGPDGPIELYDLNTDVGETTDVAAKHPDEIAAARKHFAASRADSPNFPIQPKQANSPDRAARKR